MVPSSCSSVLKVANAYLIHGVQLLPEFPRRNTTKLQVGAEGCGRWLQTGWGGGGLLEGAYPVGSSHIPLQAAQSLGLTTCAQAGGGQVQTKGPTDLGGTRGK